MNFKRLIFLSPYNGLKGNDSRVKPVISVCLLQAILQDGVNFVRNY